MELCRADNLHVKLPTAGKQYRANEREQNENWKELAGDAAKEIRENRKPFEDGIADKRNRLQLLDNYSCAFSNNKIIHVKDLLQGSYNVIALRETQTQYGEKYTMLLATDKIGMLGRCYSNNYIETYLHCNLTDAEEEIRDRKRKYLTLYEKPLAVLKITGWGRTPHRNVVVYSNITLAKDMEQYAFKHLQEQVKKEIQDEEAKLRQLVAHTMTPTKVLPLLSREEMVSYKQMQNLAEPPLGSTHIVVGIGHVEHYGQEKLFVKLDDSTIYQARDNLEQQKEQLMYGCKWCRLDTWP